MRALIIAVAALALCACSQTSNQASSGLRPPVPITVVGKHGTITVNPDGTTSGAIVLRTKQLEK